MLLKDLCNPDVVHCARTTTAAAAARLMRQRHLGDLVVVDDPDDARTPVGIVTDRDLVIEVMAEGRDPAHVTVGVILGTPVVVAREDEDAATAIERMRAHGIRRLPVVDARERLIGVITLDDVLRFHADQAQALAEIVGREQAHEHRHRR